MIINKNQVVQLGFAAGSRMAVDQFSAEDANAAFRNGLTKYLSEELSITTITPRVVREHRNAIFAIIEEVVDEVLPKAMEDRIGQFAEIKSFARDAQPIFHVKQVGRNRVKRAIQPGARGGLYRAYRLDKRDLEITTTVESVAYQITLEDLLTGAHSLSDLVSAVADGFEEKVLTNVVAALRATYATLLSANKAAATTPGTIDYDGLDKVLGTVSNYGSPMLLGFRGLMNKLTNNVTQPSSLNPNLPTADLDEIRNRGIVSIYKSYPVVVLPNYFIDETNTTRVFKEADIFILPIDEKPVKVALKGEAFTAEVQQPHGGMEYHVHKMMGVTVLFNNNIGMYHDTTADTGLF